MFKILEKTFKNLFLNSNSTPVICGLICVLFACSLLTRNNNNLEGGLTDFRLEGIAEYIQKYNPINVIFLVGAGISTSAGIPDFRTPGLFYTF